MVKWKEKPDDNGVVTVGIGLTTRDAHHIATLKEGYKLALIELGLPWPVRLRIVWGEDEAAITKVLSDQVTDETKVEGGK